MGRNPHAAAFAHWLSGQMRERNLSNRRLGKLVDPERPERGRRQVLRHLSGSHFPNDASRASYAAIFGEEYQSGDDDEEDSLDARLLALTREAAAIRRALARQGAEA